MDNWPKKIVDFNKLGSDSNKYVIVQNSGILEDDFYKYANNFYLAGDEILIDAIKSGDITKLDSCYFALVYLYRQSLELLIKAIIFKYVQNSVDRENVLKLVRHDLSMGLDSLVKESGATINSDNYLWLKDFLDSISKVDRESDMFRYPFGNNMRVLFNSQTNVSLEATYYNFDRAFDILKEFYNKGYFVDKEYDKKYNPDFIISGGTYYMQSVVGYMYNQRKYAPYYESYQSSGNYLGKLIVEDNKKELFMPMCYLFRNAIELGLKRLIIEDSHLDDKKKEKALTKKKHSISGLWNSIYNELCNYKTSSNDDTLDIVGKYINMFHDMDGSSSLFRYPCDKDMNLFFKNAKKLDVENVMDCFNDLLEFLSSVSLMMSSVKECEEEVSVHYKRGF